MTGRTTLAPHILARWTLALLGGGCVIGMVGPFQGAEEALVPWDKAAHFLAFYAATALLYLSFPCNRRVDLTFLVTLAGAGIEIMQGLTGRDADIGDIFANAMGAMAVLAPTFIEPLRAWSRDPAAVQLDRRRPRLERAEPARSPATPSA